MSRYIEAPNIWVPRNDETGVFLAGGITNCPDWQSRACGFLLGKDDDIVALNPRRKDFPIDDPSAAEEQITWEFNHLEMADIILFWFPASKSVQPIALYELGRHATLSAERSSCEIAVGCDPEYLRRQDVEIQLRLAGVDVPVRDNLADVCLDVIEIDKGLW